MIPPSDIFWCGKEGTYLNIKNTCEHCGVTHPSEMQEINYSGYSAWLCWKCIARFDNEMEDVVLKYTH